MDILCTSKSRYIAKIPKMGVSKTSDQIQIKIKIPNPSQEPPASSKAPNQDLKDMDVLCTFKMKIESQKRFEYVCIKDQWQHGCSFHLHNQERKPKFASWTYPSPVPISRSRSRCQGPPASSKATYQDLMGMDFLFTFKFKMENQNLDHGCIKDQWPYQNQDQDAKPRSVTSIILKTPK